MHFFLPLLDPLAPNAESGGDEDDFPPESPSSPPGGEVPDQPVSHVFKSNILGSELDLSSFDEGSRDKLKGFLEGFESAADRQIREREERFKREAAHNDRLWADREAERNRTASTPQAPEKPKGPTVAEIDDQIDVAELARDKAIRAYDPSDPENSNAAYENAAKSLQKLRRERDLAVRNEYDQRLAERTGEIEKKYQGSAQWAEQRKAEEQADQWMGAQIKNQARLVTKYGGDAAKDQADAILSINPTEARMLFTQEAKRLAAQGQNFDYNDLSEAVIDHMRKGTATRQPVNGGNKDRRPPLPAGETKPGSSAAPAPAPSPADGMDHREASDKLWKQMYQMQKTARR